MCELLHYDSLCSGFEMDSSDFPAASTPKAHSAMVAIINSAARAKGIKCLDKIKYAVLERNGAIRVIEKQEE